jgi:endonuclease YncB( thermonuclease family)
MDQRHEFSLRCRSTSQAHPPDVEFQPKVIPITDGDTITVLTEAKEQKVIRLNGIDCAEDGQSYGNKAKDITKELIGGWEGEISKLV